jgi:hypothetical protein
MFVCPSKWGPSMICPQDVKYGIRRQLHCTYVQIHKLQMAVRAGQKAIELGQNIAAFPEQSAPIDNISDIHSFILPTLQECIYIISKVCNI